MLPCYALSFSIVLLIFPFLFSSSSIPPPFFYPPVLRTLPLLLWLWHPPVNLSPSFQVSACTYMCPLFAWTLSLPALWTNSHTLRLSPQRNQGCQHTCRRYTNAVRWPAVGRYLCRWFGWGYCLCCTVRQGWEKWFPVGVWGPDPFLPSPPIHSLWGPVRPRYFPSLIDSRDVLLAGGALSLF